MATTRASSARAAVDHSFEELYRGHHRDVYRVVLRELGNVHDAEDVTQAAFLDAYRAVLRGSEPQAPRAWLLAIAENVRRRRYRTSQRRPREEPLDADFPVAAELPHELAQTLADALTALPSEQRRVFLLREVAGLSYDEIAERVDATVASVQMLLFRARRSLRAQLEPPTVSRGRIGLLLPVPDWLTGLLPRLESAGLAPRVAGAVGASVLGVVGASVAVSDSQADAPPSVVARAPELATPRAAVPAGRGERRAPIVKAGIPKVVPRPRAPSAQEPAPSVAAPAASAPAPASTSTAVPKPVASAVQALERPRLRLPLPKVKVGGLPELPLPPPPSTASIGEAVGAVGTAGAGAPPLPLPTLPLETLPPA